jgi:colicin import membrane protein
LNHPQPPTTERASDRWISVILSVLLHGSVIGLLVYGWWSFRRPPPPPTLAIDATVVDGRVLNGARTPRPPAPPTPPKPAPAPPTPDADAQRIAEEQKQAELKHEQQQAAERQAEQEKLAQQKTQEQAKQKAEEQAERKAEQEAEQQRLAAAKRAAEEKRQAEEKHQAEEKRKAEEKRQAEEAQLNADSQAELQRNLAAEERLVAVRTGPAMSSWIQQITARIQRAWIRPPSARAGIDCTLNVTQVPGGEIVSVKLGSCNGDEAVRESIEAAAYRASPLPPPPDPALFERDLEIHFRPTD